MNLNISINTANQFCLNKLQQAAAAAAFVNQQAPQTVQPQSRYLSVNNNITNCPSPAPQIGSSNSGSSNISNLGLTQQQHNLLQSQAFDPYSFRNMNCSINLNPLAGFNASNIKSGAISPAPSSSAASSTNLLASVIAANNINTYQSATCSLNNTLFVGNLHASLQEIDLIQVFRPFGRIVECCKKWLHFGFVKFTTEEEACHAYVTLNGFRLKGRPMRLEFQNRTKKARIKAILAQAGLPSNTNGVTDDLSSLGSLGFQNVLTDDRQMQQHHQQQLQNMALFQLNSTNLNTLVAPALSGAPSLARKNSAVDLSFFNPDQLIKFASGTENSDDKENLGSIDFKFDMIDESSDLFQHKQLSTDEMNILTQLKKTIQSPSHSPQHDISSTLSLSSDSGCRSDSCIADEDSAMVSMQLSVVKSEKIDPRISALKMKSEEITISEHLEFTCSNSSPVASEQIKDSKEIFKNEAETDADAEDNNNSLNDADDDLDCTSSVCDTSVDASEIPSDSECLNDLDLIEENFLVGDDEFDEATNEQTGRYNQVIEKDGSMVRKKLEYGIYRSINQTLSLFIEPQDILKQMDTNEYEEYNLFPTCNNDQSLGSFLLMKNQLYLI